MGKNWKAFHSSGGGGSKNDFSSCRGFAVIMGTCDAAREREATKELINILTTETEMNHDLVASDEMDRSKVDDVHGSLKDDLSSSSNSLSVEDILKNEINEIKQQRHNGSNSSIQFFTSINTGIKGIVLVRVNHKSLCPVRLLKSLFDRIRFTKLQVSRYLAKVIPLQICFFPTEVDLVATLKLVIDKEFVDCTDKSLPCLNDESLKSKKRTIDQVHGSNNCSNVEDVPDHASSDIEASTMVNNPSKEIKDSSTTPPVDIAPPASVVATRAASTYLLLFKARNHNVLSKTSCLQHLRQLMPPHMKQDYINSHNAIIIEALKNLGGISYFPDFYEYCELNIRKFQSECISLAAVIETEEGDAAVIEPEGAVVIESEEGDAAVIEPEGAVVIESEEGDAAVIEPEGAAVRCG